VVQHNSGKTEICLNATVAIALGSDHPDARAFWLNNGMDPDAFPAGPGDAWIVAVDHGASVEYHRADFDRLIPTGPGHRHQWWNQYGSGKSKIHIWIPGYDTPVRIYFKSEDQKRKGMQGAACRVIWHDEEGPDDEVWDECGSRLTDVNGWHLMSNTPVAGLTWVQDRLIDKVGDSAEPDAVSAEITALDNPHLDPKGIVRLTRGNQALVQAKLFGRATALTGRVYPMFSSSQHLIDPFPIPGSWPRFRSIDFGYRNPWVCLWTAYALHPFEANGRTFPEGTLVGYRLHYQAGWVTRQHAERIRELEGWQLVDPALPVADRPPGWVETMPGQLGGAQIWAPGPDGVEEVELTWADPEDPQQLRQLVEDHDLEAVPAVNDLDYGIDVVSDLLLPGVHGVPGYVFFRGLDPLPKEVGGYAFRRDSPKPRAKNDHTCDVIRYTAVGVLQAM
jgi:hypothetical protein